MDWNEYQDRVKETAFYPDAGRGNISALMYCAGSATGEAGEIWGQVKKAYRDDGGKLSPTRRAAIKKEIGDTFWYLAQLCNELNVDGAQVMIDNLAKLALRASTGTLSGDGDYREIMRHTIEVAEDSRWWLRHLHCPYDELACPFTLAASVANSRLSGATPPANYEVLLDERGELVFGAQVVALNSRARLVPTRTPLPQPWVGVDPGNPVGAAMNTGSGYGWALTFIPEIGSLAGQEITRTFWYQRLSVARGNCLKRYGNNTVILEGHRTDGEGYFEGDGSNFTEGN